MKKSKMYRLAQGAVVTNEMINIQDKLEILRELIRMEDLSEFCEQHEEKEKETSV